MGTVPIFLETGQVRTSLLVLLLVAVIAALVYYWPLLRREGGPSPPVEGPVPRETAAPAASAPSLPTPTLPPGLPELDGSDAFIRQLARTLSQHPRFTEWLVTENLLRRFVVVVDNVAEGVSPRKQLGFLEPRGELQAVEREGKLVVDPRSYHRYDLAAEVFVSLDARSAIELYRRLEPLVERSYRELGYPDRRFQDTLLRAIDNLLTVPVVEEPIEIDQRVVSYKIVDPRLKSLDAAQQHLLRMGPENVKRVQAKLRELRETLAG